MRGYVALTKPRILLLVIFTGLPVMGMATGARPSPLLVVATLLGTALAAAAANTLNCYIERDRDALMARTRTRPLPANVLQPSEALVFGLALAVLAIGILLATGGPLAAGLGIASILFYVFVYTVWLKPRSPLNAVIGGAAGAVAPVIADAAVHGHISAAGWILFAIILLWQPPHVWAIALFRKDDYQRAGIPMMPNVVGDQPTRWRMLWYTLALVPVTLAPLPLGVLGFPYAVCAAGLDVWFVWHCVRVLRERTDRAARRMFHVSLIYLFALFAAMLVDLAVR
ncbi:MAG TPA: protoheme IX farnesyltransferase [Deltaproteobacteria bacterium]|jgi:protoheme IX farnesyltransferase|nr:protoheme IX farnesyltransferase [Deltaproteobacteria bacterium]